MKTVATTAALNTIIPAEYRISLSNFREAKHSTTSPPHNLQTPTISHTTLRYVTLRAIVEKLQQPKFCKFVYRFWFGARVEIPVRTYFFATFLIENTRFSQFLHY